MRTIAVLLLAILPIAVAVAGEPLASGEWTAHGFDAAAKAALSEHLATSASDGKVPGGAILLMHRGEVIFREGFGFGHLRRQLPFTSDSAFRVASISKPIIATLAVKLDADGVLDLDKSIAEYVPILSELRLKNGVAPGRMPSLHECLKHTAGFLTDYDEGGRPWLTHTGNGLTLEQVVAIEAKIPLSREPGEKFAYSGIGYDIVGRIIEVVTQQPLNDVLQSELCEPLGMARTSYYPSAESLDTMPSFYWQWRSDGKFRRRLDAPPVPPTDYVSVGGGIASTLDDLARFMLLHRDAGRCGKKQLISESALTRMYVRRQPGSYYGLGFMLGPAREDGLASWIYHSGSSGTMIWWDRERDVIGILATQHHRSAGEKMPESQKVIPADAPTWQEITKAKFIDPVLGWTGPPLGGKVVAESLE